MAKKSLLLGIILIIALGLAGLFLVFPEQARAGIAISSELGSQSSTEISVITSSGSSVVSGEVDDQTAATTLPNDEGSFTTPSDDGGGGGGGGGGGSRRTPPVVETPAICVFPYLQKYIKFGQANDPVEVAKLQRFLHDFQGFSNVAVTGIYDEPTLTAVMAFQRRYAQDILEPWGLTVEQPTGYVFITTTLVINRLYCGYSTKHNLDLRNVYDYQPITAISHKASVSKKVEVAKPIVASTTPCATTSETVVVNGDQAAAVGFLNFLKDNLWFWLIPLLILILIFAGYYLWWEGAPAESEDYDDEDYSSPEGIDDEVVITEEENNVPDNLPVDSLPEAELEEERGKRGKK